MMEKYVDITKLELYSVSEIAEAAAQTKNTMYLGGINNGIMKTWLATENDVHARKLLVEQYGEQVTQMLSHTSTQLMRELIVMVEEIAPEQEERIALLMAEIAKRGFSVSLPVVTSEDALLMNIDQITALAQEHPSSEHSPTKAH